MRGDKVLIFGSFTEDETRVFQGKPGGSTPRPLENPVLQFGSLDFSSLSLQKGPSSDTNQNCSSVRSRDSQNKLVSKDNVCKDKEEKASISLHDRTVQANGGPDTHIYQNNGVLGNGKDTLYLVSVPISANQDEITEMSVCSKSHDRTKNKSTIVNSTAVVTKTVDVPKASNGKQPVATTLLPRGLINTGNICFLNATLQALLSCSPFVLLLQDLRDQTIPKIGYPTLSAFVEFISNFDMPDCPSSRPAEKGIVECGKCLYPYMFDPVLRNFTPDLPSGTSARPSQEDAQEFLSFVMDQMHDELLKLNGNYPYLKEKKLALVSTADDEDGWETIGPKNKSAVTRTQSFVPSELSEIFGGQLRSVVKARGNKASATIQPFLLLHLDILPEAVQTVEDALHLFSVAEALEGYKTLARKDGAVSAHISVKIQTLSKIMILHLMRFSYGSNGSTKLLKPVHFPLELVVSRELIASPSQESRRYELVATITHHGREASKGHYTCDARHSGGQWLRFDDASITAINTSKVLHDQAYVLFYKQI